MIDAPNTTAAKIAATKIDAMLACPVCYADVATDDQRSWVVCSGCGRRYPVTDGIPVMIAASAEIS